MTTAVHGDEPPDRRFHALADGEQAVIPQDDGFRPAERFGDAVAFGGFVDDAGVVIEQRVILVESAGILRDRIELASQGGPRLPIHGVRMGGGYDVGTRGVYP